MASPKHSLCLLMVAEAATDAELSARELRGPEVEERRGEMWDELPSALEGFRLDLILCDGPGDNPSTSAREAAFEGSSLARG